ncbi:hypothetical protein [Nocardia sp. NPDC051832]|uniref:hypothetical protein n=1 Tax=Nocardia sp. NPDC051832 TaxID=3155673 RepID=UPI003439A5AE
MKRGTDILCTNPDCLAPLDEVDTDHGPQMVCADCGRREAAAGPTVIYQLGDVREPRRQAS